MPALWEMVPDVEVLLGLEPEELGRCRLVVINERQRQSGTVCIPNYLGEFFYREPRYPAGRQHEVEGAILEAFSWLSASGLLIPQGPAHGAA
jgi:hypothetical protein